MKTPLSPSETILKEGAANLQRGVETVGGRLYLTNERLVFESHAFNVQTGSDTIPLAEIVGVEKCWTKFLNVIPLVSNSLAVKMAGGREFRFVAFGRGAWADAILAAKGR